MRDDSTTTGLDDDAARKIQAFAMGCLMFEEIQGLMRGPFNREISMANDALLIVLEASEPRLIDWLRDARLKVAA